MSVVCGFNEENRRRREKYTEENMKAAALSWLMKENISKANK